jgi:hypothetical protein
MATKWLNVCRLEVTKYGGDDKRRPSVAPTKKEMGKTRKEQSALAVYRKGCKDGVKECGGGWEERSEEVEERKFIAGRHGRRDGELGLARSPLTSKSVFTVRG